MHLRTEIGLTLENQCISPHYENKGEKPHISSDAEKAFDEVKQLFIVKNADSPQTKRGMFSI